MNKWTFKKIEIILSDFPNYEDYINEREEKILYPHARKDTNTGGGQSNLPGDRTGSQAVSLADDRVLQNLKRQQKIIQRTYDNADEIVQRIIKEYYFTKPRTKTWDGIAFDEGWSRRQCINLRNAFFENLADELGLPK